MSLDINRVIGALTADPLGKALWERALLTIQLEDARNALEQLNEPSDTEAG